MEIFNAKQWLMWSDIDGRKVPKNAKWQTVGATDTASYMDYVTAYLELKRSPCDGLAFCFTRADPWGGIDLDDCLNEDGSVQDWAKPILERCFGTYIETSPSGRGLKIYGRFKKPPGMPCVARVGTGQIEVYDHSRFFAFTHQQWAGSVKEVGELQTVVEWIAETYFDRVSLAQLETWPTERRGNLHRRAAGYIGAVGDPGKGNRNNQLYKLCGHLFALRDGDDELDYDEVFDLAIEWNQQLAEPMPIDEVRLIVRNAKESQSPRPPKHNPINPELPEAVKQYIRELEGELAAPEPPIETSQGEPVDPDKDKPYTSLAFAIDHWRWSWQNRMRPVVWRCGLPGWEIGPGMVVVLGGGPGSGKTTLACQIAKQICLTQDVRVLITSVEVPPREIWLRLLSGSAQLDYTRLRTMDHHYCRAAMEKKILTKAEELHSLLGDRIFFSRPPYDLTRIVEVGKSLRPQLILIDYIQRVQLDVKQPRELIDEMSGLMSAARRIADMGIGVLVVSSLARPEKRSEGYTRPGITSFRGSAELEYAADEAWLMVRKDGGAKLHHAKSRYRPTSDLELIQDRNLSFSVLSGIGDCALQESHEGWVEVHYED